MNNKDHRFRTGLLSAVVVSTVFANTTIASSLQDVEGNMFENAINYLVDEGVVSGYPDGTFQPSKIINRAELLKIILEASDTDLNGASNDCFADVKGDDWYVKYVCKGKEMGIVQGYSDGTFKPAQNVNFVESLKITLLGYGQSVTGVSDPWYTVYVDTASGFNMIPLTIVSFDQYLTRGEMADMITRLNKKQDGSLDDYLLSSFGEAGVETVVSYESIQSSAGMGEGSGDDDNIDDLLLELDQLMTDVNPEDDFADFEVN